MSVSLLRDLERFGARSLLSPVVEVFEDSPAGALHLNPGCLKAAGPLLPRSFSLEEVWLRPSCSCLQFLQGAPAELSLLFEVAAIMNAFSHSSAEFVGDRSVPLQASRLLSAVERSLADLVWVSPTFSAVRDLLERVRADREALRVELSEVVSAARMAALECAAAKAVVDDLGDPDEGMLSADDAESLSVWLELVASGVPLGNRLGEFTSSRFDRPGLSVGVLESRMASLLSSPSLLCSVSLPPRPPKDELVRLLLDSGALRREGLSVLVSLPEFALSYLGSFRGFGFSSPVPFPADLVVLENMVGLWEAAGPLNDPGALLAAAALVQH